MKHPNPEARTLYQEVMDDNATWVDALFWYALGVISASSVIIAISWSA